MNIIEIVSAFFEGRALIVYLVIFLAKMTEVSLCTLRQVLINRGVRVVGSLIALVEIMIWLFVAGSILSNYRADPLKMIPYALAYAMGNYFGSLLDERLALGMCSIQAVLTNVDTANKVADTLRANHFGISELNALGINNEPRYVIVSTAKRREAQLAVNLIMEIDSSAMVTVSDIRSIRGGYLNSTPVRGFHVGHKK